jgi:leucyl-tRNA---protein transferase
LLYRPQCPVCRACQAIRLPVAEFRSTAGQRRAWRRGEQQLTCHVGEPAVDARRVRLFNRHRLERGLATQSISADEYAGFLVASCCPMIEFDFFHGAQLAAVAIADRGQTSLSAVYCYYDPRLSGHSLGTYAILKQVDFCRQQRLRFLYLGLFVAANPHMSYKDRFRPNERLVDGKWRRIED